jgi:hypothetical protein
MSEHKHPYWGRQLDGLAVEMSRLCIVCDIPMLEPGIGERVLRGDQGVCGRRNPAVFETLRKHLMAYCQLEERAIKRLGVDDVRVMLDEVRDAVAKLRGEDEPEPDA